MPDRFTDLLSEYLDDDLPAGARAEVDAHLSGCAACRALLGDLRRVVAAARTLRDVPPARDLWPGLLLRLRARRRRATAWRAAAAAGLLIAGALLTLLYTRAETARMDRWLLLLHENPPRGDEPLPDDAERRAIIGEYAAWRRAHAVQGEKLADEDGVSLTPSASTPFTLTRDFVAGLFVVEAPDAEAAAAIARTCPHLKFGGWIELRRIEDT